MFDIRLIMILIDDIWFVSSWFIIPFDGIWFVSSDDCWWYMIRLVLVYDSSCHVSYSSHHDSYWWHMIRLVMIYYTLWWYRICVVMFEMTLGGDIWFVSSWLWYMRLWVSIVLMYPGFVLCTCAHVYFIKCCLLVHILCVHQLSCVYVVKERRREPSLMTLWTWLFH